MKKIVVLASGSGTNFQAVIDSVQDGTINATISGLIAGKAGIGAIDRAVKAEIPYYILTATTSAELEQQLLEKLNEWDPDLIVLAGFLKKIPGAVIDQYRNRIINIHPSLLPKFGGKGFYGMNVHRAVIESGEQVSGCTVHYVNEFYDQGDIIRQTSVPISKDDTPESLAKNVLKEEHKLLPEVIAELLN
ncbi:phosphoribosylglycinamide formyltransferase [Rhodohalobacter halophilus]|uniref:phosphoribosylglycinamide formyltransferase n=1 Tax=Rhodohalobacter halophilus TaxID=1812810 RepID=UPI00083F8A54|nr:phosphoribosylglycinamide formyltransferase [Rhodohalobacter halophilus]